MIHLNLECYLKLGNMNWKAPTGVSRFIEFGPNFGGLEECSAVAFCSNGKRSETNLLVFTLESKKLCRCWFGIEF